MSNIKIQSNASGTGVFTIASPNSNTDRTLTLPDESGTLALVGAGGGVTSIAGTANQITASASTGAVTLSLPATINVNTSGNAATATTASALSSATWQRITGNAITYGSYGSIGISGNTNGYAGISFSDVSGTLMMSSAATGFYYSNSTWRVYWDGSGNQINTGNVSAYASDERLKRNWRKIQDPVKIVREVGGWEFDWDLEECNKWGFFPPASDIGVSAQQTQKYVPSAVAPAPFDIDPIANTSKSGKDYLTVRYEGLVPVLLAAVDVQAGEISDLTARIAKLEALLGL